MIRTKLALLALAALVAGCQGDAMAPVPHEAASSRQASLGAGVAATVTGSAHLTAFPPELEPRPGLALRNFGFSAILYDDDMVQGEWQVVVGGTILHGAVDCLTIAPDGHSARMSGAVELAVFTFFQPGTAFAIELFDNGDGASGDPDVTTQLRAFRNADVEVGRAFCEDGTVPAGEDLDPLPTEHGNLTIHVLD